MVVLWRRERLAQRTRYRIGGFADRFAEVPDLTNLRALQASVASEPWLVLGAGANTLVSDAGVSRPVIALGAEFKRMDVLDAAIEVGAAAGVAAVVQAASKHRRAGWDFLEAVPGTIGGALHMNAGTLEKGIWEQVEWVDALVPDLARPVRLIPEDVQPGYRHIDVPEGTVFLSARLRAVAGQPECVEEAHANRRQQKRQSQPYDLPSCGSTWLNPPGLAAWRLVDEVGMRGKGSGAARISDLHANFIVNEGGATADDVIWLMRETRRRVREQHGIELIPELRLWGFPNDLLHELGASPAREGAYT
jgi:UDP-N-acetylmuramate dehydrogenase